MATSVTVDFGDNDEDPDENNYNENDTGDESFDPSSFAEDTDPLETITATPPQPGAKPFDPTAKPADPEKLADAEIRKRQSYAARKLAREQAEEKRRIQRRASDRAREVQGEYQLAKSEAKQKVTSIRSEAVQQRIQAYAASAALGLPGYTMASFADQYVLRPAEARKTAQQQQYLQQLDAYYKGLKQDELNKKRRAEDAIRNMPIEAVDVDAVRAAQGLPPLPSQAPSPTPSTPPGTPTTQPGDVGGSGGGNIGGGNIGADNFGRDDDPPRVPPVKPPETTNSTLGTIASAAGIVAAVVQVGQMMSGAIHSVGKETNALLKASVSGTAIQGARAYGNTIGKVVDPLGFNPAVQLAVVGFDNLLTLTEEIRNYAAKDISFSPRALQATVEGDLQKLVQQISLANKNDPLKAEVVRASNQLDRAWAEFQSQMFIEFAPTVIDLLKTLTLLLPVVRAGVSVSRSVADNIPVINTIRDLLRIISNNTDKQDPIVANDLIQQMIDFTDPQAFRNKAVFPNRNP